MAEERPRTFDLSLFNMATDAFQRASRIASIYDMSDPQEHPDLLRAMRAEISLGQHLIGRILDQAAKAGRSARATT